MSNCSIVVIALATVLCMASNRQAIAAEDDKSVLVLHSYLISPAQIATLQSAAKEAPVDLRFLAADSADTDTLRAEIERADLILLDVAHESVLTPIVSKSAEDIEKSDLPYILVPGLDRVRRGQLMQAASLKSQHKVSDETAARIRQYYRYGGDGNTLLLMAALATDLSNPPAADLPAAIAFPEQGFYHPDWTEIETSREVIQSKLAGDAKPIVAIAINSATLSSGDTDWLDAILLALKQRDINGYAFYGPRQNSQLFTEMTCRDKDGEAKPFADLIINAALIFRPAERKAEIDQIGVPVMQTLPSLNRDAEQWRASDDGLAMANISYYYASSELAGMIAPMLISARNADTRLLQPINQQIAALADRAAAICRLQQSQRGERRIAMMVYNYPQGENNFGASFLNVPKSLVNVIAAMKQAGYTTETIDESSLTSAVQTSLRALYDSDALISQHAAGKAGFLPLAEYQTWFDGLPAPTRHRIENHWGDPRSAAVRTESGDSGFVIPGVQLGNIHVIPQPLRHEVTAATEAELRKQRINHNSTVPLSHKYLATYLYLRQQWRADAVVHFGTHGTLEWAPGKQRALSVDDDPLLALGSLPNVYPYIMDNLGEATTAKRRSGAVMISHMTPMFSPAGFRPGLHEMHDLMHDWETIADGPVRKQMEKQLVDWFAEQKLDRDLGWSTDRIADHFEEFMEVLHPYLDDIAQTAQPQGLAVLGQVPDRERRFGMVMQMLRKRLIDALGEDIDEVFLLDAAKVGNSRPARWLRMALQDADAASRLDLRMIDNLDSSKQTSVPNRAAEKTLDADVLLELALEAQRLDALLATNNEIPALITALDGQHVPSSYGGDPVRNPDSLPTGKNLYGFDPSRVPTRQAWEIGVGVLDDWIADYRLRHENAYPQQIAFTMWAGETMRHHGVMESQIFHALGVRPRWDDTGRMKGIELVSDSDFGRPRIDVLMTVTGSYRDQFPHLMKWIDEAVVLVANHESPKTESDGDESATNFVANHARWLREQLIAEGVSDEEANRQSTARVFSNESGNYGTGLNDAAYASDLWEYQQANGGDAEMARLFVDRMGYAYGDGLDGVAASELFAKQLAGVDAAFLSRSSHTYGVLTSDDPFAYLGGFALAARAAGGESPELYVQNLRDESEIILDSAASAIAKEMQTRYLHPQWIEAQQAEGYSGTLQVLKATQFLWGWQVTSPESVREDQWQAMLDTYVNDQYELGTRQWLEEHNHHALAQVLERMVDAVRLNYWQPDSETQQALFAAYDQAARASGLIESNRQVQQFVSQQFSPTQQAADTAAPPSQNDAPSATPEPTVDAAAAAPEVEPPAATKFVQGQELRPEPAASEASQETNRNVAMVVGIALLLMILGAFLQLRRLVKTNGNRT
ncbi:cobaltochelatase subunit CobN [Rosistilla ulvae]|uniref:cobaltochelatase subunit CobN n=1 Tax=Rosistilla ulvae TaxID=1930277 RepID=UPI001C54EED9|nr:cobaltochelatase subunit CobN [Rosistilla ulvae]